MGGRALVVMITGIVVISATIFLNITARSTAISENADKNYYRIEARNIAQTGANLAMRQIEKDPAWTAGFNGVPMMDGVVSVTVANATYKGMQVIQITSVGTMNPGGSSERNDTSIVYYSRGFVPPTIKAAVTTTHLAYAQGSIVVDGREHYTSGALVGTGQGTLGVFTLKDFQQTGGGKVGGTFGGVDYPPATTANPKSYAEFQTWPGGYPNTPDAVMGGAAYGYPPGTLKAVAQSKWAGSQYVTDPKKLKYPLSGITYVDLPPGANKMQNQSITGSGILIVHSTAADGILENPSGTFTGVVMGDEIVHINATIIGGAVSMGGSEDDIINGTGKILFSRQAIGSGAMLGLGTAAVGGWTMNMIACWD